MKKGAKNMISMLWLWRSLRESRARWK